MKQEDKLLSLLRKQEEARDLLFQLLQSCSHKELQEPLLNLLHNNSEEHSHPIEEGKRHVSLMRCNSVQPDGVQVDRLILLI